MVGAVSDGPVSWRGNTLFSVSIAEAASLHYQVIDGKVSRGTGVECGREVFVAAGTSLVPQQPNSDVGDFQLPLAFGAEWI